MTRADPPIGSPDWWWYYPPCEPRGVVECILRLLEQQVITRRKALELIHYTMGDRAAEPPPAPPWDLLDWCDDLPMSGER